VARAKLAEVPGLTTRAIQPVPRALTPIDEIETRYYLRFDVADEPGVLGRIATSLGDQGVSVEQMMQEGRADNGGAAVPVLIISHRCREGAVKRAMQSVQSASFMRRPPRLMRIEDI
ncbi:MAG: ACT domain-containing protein, partial [Polyangiaceae bacterium]